MPTASSRISLPELPETRPATSQEYAYQRLRHALMVGAFEPGIAITIQEIADALEISATPVREALRQLGTENALATLANRRIRVPEITPARFEELISLRCTLEVYAARRALPYVSNILIDRLAQLDEQLDTAARDHDWVNTVLLNQRFHGDLYRANPDQMVMPMIESAWLQLGPLMGVAARIHNRFYRVDRHKQALDAMRQNDEDALAAAIEADIRDGVGHLDPQMLEAGSYAVGSA